MEIHQLRYFLAVSETGSFTRAAERCHVAQPSLSQQIKKLESALGCQLFDRQVRGAVLSEAGHALLPRARRILAEVNAVDTAIKQDLAAGSGPLLVGAIPTMAPYLLPRLLNRFMRQYPKCELTMREDFTERLVEAVVDNELDFAVLSTPTDHPALHLDVLGRERLLLTAAKDYKLPAATKKPSVRDLHEQPAVVLHEMHCLGHQIESFCSARRVTRRIVCRTAQLETVLRLVGLGLGISLVPEMCARADGAKSRSYYALGRGGPEREIAVAYRLDRCQSRLAATLIQMLRKDISSGLHVYQDA
ncbi:MAG: LysR family transcriptional regulator [Phycisphaerales bacterium]|nr:LysR family transcriptional regulator [Phycisphaerales bacterium]